MSNLIKPLSPANLTRFSTWLAERGCEILKVTNPYEVIRYRAGATYTYANVPPEAHAELMAAESIGKHFGAQIRGKFEGKKPNAEAQPTPDRSHGDECPACGGYGEDENACSCSRQTPKLRGRSEATVPLQRLVGASPAWKNHDTGIYCRRKTARCRCCEWL